MWGKKRICLENRKYVRTSIFGIRGKNEVGIYVCFVLMKLKGVAWNSIEMSYDVIQVHVWSYEFSPMRGHSWVCESRGICLTTRIGWSCNVCSSQRVRTLIYRNWRHKELDRAAWVHTRLFWSCRSVQDSNDTCKCYE